MNDEMWGFCPYCGSDHVEWVPAKHWNDGVSRWECKSCWEVSNKN